jgi:hypothetical protein
MVLADGVMRVDRQVLRMSRSILIWVQNAHTDKEPWESAEGQKRSLCHSVGMTRCEESSNGLSTPSNCWQPANRMRVPVRFTGGSKPFMRPEGPHDRPADANSASP